MGFMALLSHQTAIHTVSTPVPAIIEAKGVVMGGEGANFQGRPLVLTSTEGKGFDTSSSSPATTTSFINPNQSFMETHVPENTPEPVEVEKVDTKPEYIAPAEETPGHVDGTEYPKGGY